MKRITRLIICTLTGIFLLVGCRNEDDMLTAPQSISLATSQVSATINIKANTRWHATTYADVATGRSNQTDDQWFVITPSEGIGSCEMQLNILSASTGISPRTGAIVIDYADGNQHTIEVTQNGKILDDCYVSPTAITLGANASENHTFFIYAPCNDVVVTVTPRQSEWITNLHFLKLDQYENAVTHTYSFGVEANPHNYTREAYFDVVVRYAEQVRNFVVTIRQTR
ncbi:MAG: BACON domain-containing protein [Bacteroidales bacterium]|nr:BACON domain-containing protein [Candidatus Colimorpha onthohippi]